MAVPTLANTWKVIVHYHCGPTQFENVFHTTAPDASSEQDVADDFGAAWMDSSSLSNIQASLVEGANITVQHYDGSSAPVDCTVTGFTGNAMGAGAQPVPASVCGLITWKSGLAGRSNRGRTYLGGIDENFVETDGARWASGAFPTVQIAATQFATLLVGGTTVTGLDIYSQLHNTKAPVIEGVFRQYMGTQRRRAEQAM